MNRQPEEERTGLYAEIDRLGELEFQRIKRAAKIMAAGQHDLPSVIEANKVMLGITPDGPDEDGTSFWRLGNPYRLSEKRFRLMETLWAAENHSLPRDEVIAYVYEVKRAEAHAYKDKLRRVVEETNRVFDGTTMSIHLGTGRLGKIVQLSTS